MIPSHPTPGIRERQANSLLKHVLGSLAGGEVGKYLEKAMRRTRSAPKIALPVSSRPAKVGPVERGILHRVIHFPLRSMRSTYLLTGSLS
jgi:hypothetical protein